MRLALLFFTACLGLAAQTYDLAVYGGTAGGVLTAVSGAWAGLHVVLLEPGKHIGGMVSGGLGQTDFGNKQVIGGYSQEFFNRAGWYFEPHVAEKIFHDMLNEAHVTLLYGKRLKEQDGVIKNGSKLVSIAMEDGSRYEARIFADCSYEGDLMAQSGVSYTWGREGTAQYGESLAGVRTHTPFHQFLVPVNAYGPNHTLLPEIFKGEKGEPGSADRKVQAYNFRLCLTQRKENQTPFSKPPGYNPRRYELLARLIDALTKKNGHPPQMKDLMHFGIIPNGKTDINNNGAFSTDFIGGSWDYPEASYRRRAEIRRTHVAYTQGFLWFLGHDLQVPQSLRDEVNSWGLASDEFTDTEHWPHQLYIREARRMTGDFVMTQKDLQTELKKPDSIGMGSYNSDSHNVQRIATPEGLAENEGDMQVPVKPYEIPYRILLPKPGEASNLLVPVCFSASHVAYSSVRMEPQYMILGQAAGNAAALAIRNHQAVQEIDVAQLQEALRKQNAVLSLPLPDGKAIDAEIGRIMARTGAKGMAIAVIDSGKVGYVQSYGIRNAKGDPLTTDTVMYGASLTKTLFAYTVLQLVDQGKLNLDTPLAGYLDQPLPSYGPDPVFPDKYGPYKDLAADPRWRKITARMCLDHSTGFSNFWFIEPDQKLQIHFDPGTRFSYSGEGFILLQFVVEHGSKAKGLGLDVGDLTNANFKRLEMTRTNLIWHEGQDPNVADGWNDQGQPQPHSKRSKVRAAGSMNTTISDLAKFTAALVRGDGLTPASRAEFTRPVLHIPTRSQFPLFQQALPEAGQRKDLYAGPGVILFDGPQGHGFYKGGHDGQTANTMVCLDSSRRCVLILSNDVRSEAGFADLVKFDSRRYGRTL